MTLTSIRGTNPSRDWIRRVVLPCEPVQGQRGAVLITGLIILAVMSVIGINSMRGTVLEERLAGNLKDQVGGFQAAEAGVQAALTAIEGRGQPPRADAWGSGSLYDACKMVDADDTTPCTLVQDALSDWAGSATPTYGVKLAGFGGSALGEMSDDQQPRVVVESRYVGLGEEENFEVAVQRRGVHLFTVTALGTGPSGQSETILQTTIPKVYAW